MAASYNTPGVRLARGATLDRAVVLELQTDLRKLGYLRGGLDGSFGPGTERAVRALQQDLLHNDGAGKDGTAPVALRALNGGRVTSVTGVVDEGLAACLADILGNARVTTLPRSDDPAGDNARVLAAIEALDIRDVPKPFLMGILWQESRLEHFRVPTADDADAFIVVGLDTNDASAPDRITSRGYGIGQFTLFHHPPRPDEVAGIMADPARNVERAVAELQEKFNDFVVATPAARADDRIAAFGAAPLRRCRYDAGDPKYQADCRQCARSAPRMDIAPGAPLFPGSNDHFAPTQYHPETRYDGLPDWKTFGCDWPYAVRRYNGSGVNSYHYQAEVMARLAT